MHTGLFFAVDEIFMSFLKRRLDKFLMHSVFLMDFLYNEF
jgi:hypothetical protein